MIASSPEYHDVLIAGAGPVGLVLACELGSAGCSVLVVDDAERAETPYKHVPFGLRGLSAATLDLFDRRGLLEPLRARTDANEILQGAEWATRQRRPGGHFAGIDFFLDRIDRTCWSYRLPHAPDPMASDLWSIESVLTARALDAGATIRRGSRVSGVDADEGGVLLHAAGETFRGGWLVGCDGGRSAVRKAAGFTFAGTEPEFTGYFAQVVLADPDALDPGHHDTAAGTYIYERPGTIRMAEFDGGASHRAGPITREHVESVLRRVSGADVRVTGLGLATTWTDRAYLAGEYRRGRVLLAGDAAHVHSPLGGRGLNLGIGDAANLGWKLAMAVRGDAPADLLDSYGRERRPVAEQVLDWSRAQVALMRPGPGTRALREVVRDLIETRDGATHVAERVWGLGLRYDLGSDHPLVGRSAPDVALADGSRLNEHLRGGRALLLAVAGDDRLRVLAERRSRYVDYLEGVGGIPGGARALLVRPDGVVAWASDRPTDGCGADAALSRWFGDGEN